MLILLSPAKTQQFEYSRISSIEKPHFEIESEIIISAVSKLSGDEIAMHMKIKGKILDSTINQFDALANNREGLQTTSALSAYSGPAFKSLDSATFTDQMVLEAKRSLIILSGLYGVLHANSAVSPYRFEMGLSFKPDGENGLYSFWKSKITNYLSGFCRSKSHSLVVNLASKEYSKAIDFKNLSVPVKTIEFRELKDGKLKSISSYAKQARGSMARWILETSPQNEDDLMKFCVNGYEYSSENSTDEILFFVRKS